MIFLNSSRIIKKVLTTSAYRDVTNDRPPSFLKDYLYQGGQDIGFNDYNNLLVKLRKISHTVIRLYGEGVHDFEKMINPEVDVLIEKLAQATDKESFDMDAAFSESLIRIIHVFLTNERLEAKEAEEVFSTVEEFNNTFNRIIAVDKNLILLMFPWLQHIPGSNGDLVRKLRHEHKKILRYFLAPDKTEVCHASTNFQLGNGSLIGTLRLEQDNDKELTDTMIEGVVSDMVIGGFSTTHGALDGIFLLMMKYPEVQRRLQKEIDDRIGDEEPSLADRSKLPYTNAVILECLRYIRHIPLGIPHYVREDIEIEGYTIPAKSTLVTNLYHTCKDEMQWEKPYEFYPERFLDVDGNLLPSDHPTRQQLIPFSVGRRNCIGESFAKSRMFLYVTRLLQKFEFQRGKNKLVSEDSSTWIRCAALHPQHLNCKIVARK
ncbi:hypothetical protein LOTGIDRAFT_128891 [Lottia gigantea]|uniref:Cytochrome P450 n=1 Tax=Lottia gigantea TaxID=225164 RepID=V3Z6Z0_LOTGI|nr:hypothetical protein LOTGIDRAFT_128891 [Lottia gigantea]ESO86598.1 hypothetical protein LOTGIDRAFT_128891 [Lottia gigantea]